MKIEDVIGDYKKLYKDLISDIKDLGIDTSNLYVDHFCFRTSSLKNYEVKKVELFQLSDWFLENIHNNRPISKFILKEPLVFENQRVSIIELPAPKVGVSYKDGIEHFEFVVGKNFTEFKNKYSHLWTGQDDSGEFNKPVYIKLKSGVVKFHEKPLDEVIRLEGNKFIKVIL